MAPVVLRPARVDPGRNFHSISLNASQVATYHILCLGVIMLGCIDSALDRLRLGVVVAMTRSMLDRGECSS